MAKTFTVQVESAKPPTIDSNELVLPGKVPNVKVPYGDQTYEIEESTTVKIKLKNMTITVDGSKDKTTVTVVPGRFKKLGTHSVRYETSGILFEVEDP